MTVRFKEPPVRLAPTGRMHHTLSRVLPSGWTVREFGPDGAAALSPDRSRSLVVTRALAGGVGWVHASLAVLDGGERWAGGLPAAQELQDVYEWVFAGGHAYQQFSPAHTVADPSPTLHLWGRTDSLPVLPDFRAMGMA